jgi:alanine racemase
LLNWVEIDARTIHWNVTQFRRRLGPDVLLGAVVKSNAYGHGMLEVAALACEAGADWLCVNNVDEAVCLREAGHRTEILVMGYIPGDQLGAVVEHRLRPVVYNLETVDRLDRLAPEDDPVGIHLKVETGTHRQGIGEAEVVPFAQRVQRSPRLALEGISTHFANIEDSTDHSFAQAQMAAFGRISEALAAAGMPVLLRHAACSAATLLFTRTHLDLARVGISLYGLWPSKETYVSCLERGKPTLDLHPTLTWKTRIAQVKTVEEGGYIGYGCTYRVTRRSRIAVLPVGYHEGYDRGLSGVAHVLVRGRRAPVRGRVCMNMCMVDVSDIPGVSLEDEVVLLGRQGDECVSAEQLAEWCGTISYEIVSRIHPALARIVVHGNVTEPVRHGQS